MGNPWDAHTSVRLCAGHGHRGWHTQHIGFCRGRMASSANKLLGAVSNQAQLIWCRGELCSCLGRRPECARSLACDHEHRRRCGMCYSITALQYSNLFIPCFGVTDFVLLDHILLFLFGCKFCFNWCKLMVPK
jgi:hypothetical protein